MQMVMMTFRSSLEGEVQKFLKEERVSFTFVEEARGKGETGQDIDKIVLGGTNTVLFAGIPDEQLTGFRAHVQEFNRELTKEGKVSLPFHIFVMPCIQWF